MAYKLVPYMVYADKLNDHHKEQLEETYKRYKEGIKKFNGTSLYDVYEGRIDGLETAMLHIGYKFVEVQEEEKQ